MWRSFGGHILTSSDGTTWTSRTSGTTSALNDVVYGNSAFVAVGAGGTAISSSDGTSWGTETSGTTNTLNGVTYGNSIWVIVGEGGLIRSSVEEEMIERTSGTNNHLYRVIYKE